MGVLRRAGRRPNSATKVIREMTRVPMRMLRMTAMFVAASQHVKESDSWYQEDDRKKKRKRRGRRKEKKMHADDPAACYDLE